MMRLLFTLMLMSLTLPATAQVPGDEMPVDKAPYEEAQKLAAKRTEADRTRFAGKAHILVKPGLWADKKIRTVTLYGASTGLGTEDVIEFLIIQAGSPKAYEALSIAFARPSDIREAMTFIGMEPGHPVSYQNLRFWPRGERVIMHVSWNEKKDGSGKDQTVRIEDMVYDKRAEKPMAKTGFMYTGSYFETDDKGKRVLAADVSENQSIASTFNAVDTLFDLPTQAPQGQMFGQYLPNDDYPFKAWWPISITIKPEGKQRVVDLTLRVAGGQPTRFDLLDDQGKSRIDEPTIRAALSKFDELGKKDKDVYVTFAPADDLGLKVASDVSKLLSAIDNPGGVRVGPPNPGDLYYRAFLPNPKWAKPDGRLFHGWDVRLTESNGKISATLVSSDDEKDANGKWIVTQKPYPDATTPQQIAATVKKIDTRGPRDIFVFAPADLTYGTLLQWIGPAMKTHPTIHVFVGN